MKRTLLISFLLLCFSCIEGFSQNEEQQLVVWLKSGERIYFNLKEEPETTFENGLLVITSDKTTAMYHLENVIRYTFEGDVTAIKNPSIRPGELRYSQGNDSMIFEGLPDGMRLEVYATDGKLISISEAKAGKPTLISLEGMPTGTYIIKANDATFKFLKK